MGALFFSLFCYLKVTHHFLNHDYTEEVDFKVFFFIFFIFFSVILVHKYDEQIISTDFFGYTRN